MNNKFFYIALMLIVGMGVFIAGENVIASETDCDDASGTCCSYGKICWGGKMHDTYNQCKRCCIGGRCENEPEKECAALKGPKGTCVSGYSQCEEFEAVPAKDCNLTSDCQYCCITNCPENKTCEEYMGQGYNCCGHDEYCAGKIIDSGICDCGIYNSTCSLKSRCCDGECSEHPDCDKDLKGDCCTEDETSCIGGNFKATHDCDNRCCVGGVCAEPSTDRCKEDMEGVCCRKGQECEGGIFDCAADCDYCCKDGGTCKTVDGPGPPAEWGECAENNDCISKYGAGYECECLPKGYTGTEKIGLCAPAGSTVICPPTRHTSFAALLDSIINFIFNIVLVIAPIMFIIAGFSYITCAGDPAKIKKSADIAIYTAVGLIVVLLAKGIIQVIQDIVV